LLAGIQARPEENAPVTVLETPAPERSVLGRVKGWLRSLVY
jgi:hypothetical protein